MILCVSVLSLFNFYAEYITCNARLDEAQDGINIARRNVNNLRYTDDTTPVSKSEEELKNLLMRVKEESEKAGFKTQHKKAKVTAPGHFTSLQIEGKKWKQ